jgi:NAD(P)H-hydrate epimerase
MRLITREQSQAIDKISINEMGIQGSTLMGNAGNRIAEKAISILDGIPNPIILIICGKGNNGGDGFA